MTGKSQQASCSYPREGSIAQVHDLRPQRHPASKDIWQQDADAAVWAVGAPLRSTLLRHASEAAQAPCFTERRPQTISVRYRDCAGERDFCSLHFPSDQGLAEQLGTIVTRKRPSRCDGNSHRSERLISLLEHRGRCSERRLKPSISLVLQGKTTLLWRPLLI